MVNSIKLNITKQHIHSFDIVPKINCHYHQIVHIIVYVKEV